jgi:hypothetical protein
MATSPRGTKKSSSKRKATSEVVMQTSGDQTIRVEKIENGFLVSKSGMVGKGRNARYTESKIFSQTNPVQINTPSLKFGKK